MSPLVTGLALAYAICGVVSTLIYLTLLPQARNPSLLAHLPVLVLIAISGPITGWVMFWGTISERIALRTMRAKLEHELPTLVAQMEKAALRSASADARAAELFNPPYPNNRRWN